MTPILVVVAMTTVGGALVLGIVFLMVVVEKRRTDHDAMELSTELRVWAERNGWAADDAPPPALTAAGIDEVNFEEHRRLTLTGTLDGRSAAMTWCTWSDNNATYRYAALLVELPESFATLRVRQRYGPAPWRRDRLKVHIGSVSAPVREALDRLRSAIGWHDEFVHIQDNVMRVVIGSWPRPAMVDAALSAAAGVMAALSASGSENRPSPQA